MPASSNAGAAGNQGRDGQNFYMCQTYSLLNLHISAIVSIDFLYAYLCQELHK